MSLKDKIQITPICGGRENGPVCSLLDICGVRILLDCGYYVSSKRFDFEAFRSKIGRVDAVLLSHADINHIGALPLLFGVNGMYKFINQYYYETIICV